MVKQASKYICFLILINSFISYAFSNEHASFLVSPFNQKVLQLKATGSNYSFLLGGHLYGESTNQLSVYPSASILANIETINNTDADFFISLGDIYRKASPKQLHNFNTSFADKLNMPLFNVVGNHDMYGDFEVYLNHVGQTYFAFQLESELFIILDTYKNHGRIVDEQFDFFKQQITLAEQENTIKNIFVFTHRPIWQEVIDSIDFEIHEYPDVINYSSDLHPLIQDLSSDKSVYLVSDDIGGEEKQLSFFYHQDQNYAIKYISTGIGNVTNDALLKVDLAHGVVDFRPLPLNADQNYMSLEKHHVEHWKGNVDYRPFTEKIWSRFYNVNFRYGLFVGLFVGFVFVLIFNRKKS